MSKVCIVTTSWDDGHIKDLKLASLLNKYSLKGTFYIPKVYLKEGLNKKQIRDIASQYEIGAHTLTHIDLIKAAPDNAKRQIAKSKEYLEDLLSRQIRMFAYPYGRYNSMIKKMVKDTGFKGARSLENLSTAYPGDNFNFGITLQISPQTFKKNFSLCFELAQLTFDYVYKNGGIWHLSGHSWEIEQYNLWDILEELFSYISKRNIVCCFNSECIKI